MSKASKQSVARDWCFTINNPKDSDWDKVWNFPYKYLVFQLEVGEEGTPHIQGFVQLTDSKRLSAMKKLHKKAHWGKRRGTPYEAAHYCQKPVGRPLDKAKWDPEPCQCKHCKDLERFDDFYEDGYLSVESAFKTAEIARVIKAKGYHHAAERFPEAVLTMGRGMLLLDTHFTPKRDYKTEVTVIWGLSRLGKTRYAYEAFPSPYLLAAHGEGTDFFGNYDPRGNETVIVDDFYSSWKYTTFLRVCDRYPTEVHTKGGFLQFLARHLVFTSNLPPDQWYKNVLADPLRKASFFNRIDNIIHFDGPVGTYVVEKGTSTQN